MVRSSENAVDVLVGAFVARGIAENDFVAIELDDLTFPEKHGALAEAAGLLGEIGDEDDGDFLAEFLQNIFDAHGGDWVDGYAEFVEAKDFGLMREGARYGEA